LFENPEEGRALRDLSGLKFLAVDEADRIMEDGHYPEVREILL
jgi:superfamily II DNA/RNA helicase